MPTAGNEQIVDTVSTTNLKTLAEGTAFATNNVHQAAAQALSLAMQNAVTTQQRMNDVGVTSSQMFSNNMHKIDAGEAHALAKLGGSDLSSLLSQLGSAIAALQVYSKTAGNVPPVTPGA